MGLGQLEVEETVAAARDAALAAGGVGLAAEDNSLGHDELLLDVGWVWYPMRGVR